MEILFPVLALPFLQPCRALLKPSPVWMLRTPSCLNATVLTKFFPFMRRNSAKLSGPHKFWVYSVTLLVYLTGVVWACLHYLAPRPQDFGVHPAEPWMLKLHGAGAMIILVVLGTLLPGHMRFAWHARRNRPNGIALVAFLGFLVLTGYGLYYLGDERLRSWTSWSHLAVGVALPAMIILHIWSGRRSGTEVFKSPKQQTRSAKPSDSF